jgi:hypothetical protein
MDVVYFIKLFIAPLLHLIYKILVKSRITRSDLHKTRGNLNHSNGMCVSFNA